MIEDLSMCGGIARADIALANRLLHGYEIMQSFSPCLHFLKIGVDLELVEQKEKEALTRKVIF